MSDSPTLDEREALFADQFLCATIGLAAMEEVARFRRGPQTAMALQDMPQTVGLAALKAALTALQDAGYLVEKPLCPPGEG